MYVFFVFYCFCFVVFCVRRAIDDRFMIILDLTVVIRQHTPTHAVVMLLDEEEKTHNVSKIVYDPPKIQNKNDGEFLEVL